MLIPQRTKAFKKDVKKLQKNQKDMSKLKKVLNLLLNEQPLPSEYKNHRLHGEYDGDMECHIESDWLLIYYTTKETLHLIRTGTHSELF